MDINVSFKFTLMTEQSKHKCSTYSYAISSLYIILFIYFFFAQKMYLSFIKINATWFHMFIPNGLHFQILLGATVSRSCACVNSICEIRALLLYWRYQLLQYCWDYFNHVVYSIYTNSISTYIVQIYYLLTVLQHPYSLLP